MPNFKYVKAWEKEKDEEGRDFDFDINRDILEECLKNSGWFVLCSSKEMSPEEAYQVYRGRTAGIESTFRAEKSFLGGDVRRTHHEDTYRGKTFVLELATILRQGMCYHFQSVFFKYKKTSLPRALGVLKHYEITTRYGRVTAVQRMTKYQKELLATLGLSEAKVKEKINEIEVWSNQEEGK